MRLLQVCDDDLLHFRHRLRHPFGFFRVGIATFAANSQINSTGNHGAARELAPRRHSPLLCPKGSLRACRFGVYCSQAPLFLSCKVMAHPSSRVQPTCGSLRVLEAFFWLRVFPAPKQNPHPPQRPVTQTIGHLLNIPMSIEFTGKIWFWRDPPHGSLLPFRRSRAAI